MDICSKGDLQFWEFFSSLKSVINEYFIPALFGFSVDKMECELFCRPICVGGLGVHDPVKTSQIHFTISCNATSNFFPNQSLEVLIFT